LPVFRPPVPSTLLLDFEKYDEDVFEYLHTMSQKIPTIKYIEYMSVIVRLKDARYSVFYIFSYY